MTSSPPLVEPLAARDGCDCDMKLATGFVDRCAHFGDDVLRLDEYTDGFRPRFAVWRLLDDVAIYYGDDSEVALAAFHAAEEALIRGDA